MQTVKTTTGGDTKSSNKTSSNGQLVAHQTQSVSAIKRELTSRQTKLCIRVLDLPLPIPGSSHLPPCDILTDLIPQLSTLEPNLCKKHISADTPENFGHIHNEIYIHLYIKPDFANSQWHPNQMFFQKLKLQVTSATGVLIQDIFSQLKDMFLKKPSLFW